jgi:hypothetical protein
VVRALAMLKTKHAERPRKKHDNLWPDEEAPRRYHQFSPNDLRGM